MTTPPGPPQGDPYQNPGMPPGQSNPQPPPPPGFPPAAPGQPWGPPGAQYGNYPGQQPKAGNGLGIAALVLGILGVLTSWLVVGGALGLVAVVLGALGLRRAGANKAMPVIGLILGGLSIVVAVLAAPVWFDLKDEIDSYAECVRAAQSQAEMDECARQFRDQVDQQQ